LYVEPLTHIQFMQAIIKLPESIVEDSKYITRAIRSTSKKSIAALLDDLCDELVYDYPEEFEVISVVTSDGEILLAGVDF
jgi:hypothetical protein